MPRSPRSSLFRGRSARLGASFVVAAASATAACGSPPPVSRIEDRARLDVPIAICRRPVAPGEAGDAGIPKPDAYWEVVFPGFRGFGAGFNPNEPDCVGEPHVADARGPQGPAVPIGQDDALVVPGADGVEAVWLRAFHVTDKIGAGPLVVARPRPSELDVYAIGGFRGSLAHSRFELARLGSAQTIVGYDDSCADVKVDTECDSSVTFFVGVGGKLVAAASSPTQRVRFGVVKGLGKVQYRLATDPPVFDKLTVRIHERLQVRDSGDEDVRKAEGDRVFVLSDDRSLVAQQDSLWSQVPKSP
jgi:hypothetical protein